MRDRELHAYPSALSNPEQVDFAAHLERLFPIVDHPLYGSIESFEQSPCLDPVVLADYSQRAECGADVTSLETCPTCFFQTSGTTSRAKRIPYTDAGRASAGTRPVALSERIWPK